jgi:Rap/ran-GAP
VGGSIACPVAISIEDKTARFALSPSMILRRSVDPPTTPDPETVVHRALVRTQSGDECLCIAVPANLARNSQTAHAEVLAQIAQALPAHTLPVHLKIGTTIFRVKSNDLEAELLQYEANNMRRCHKVGIVYCAKGMRSEAEMLSTTRANASADFQQFLTLLGQEVPLRGWADYSGGLDVKNDADGTHSIFTNFWGIPVMFHVSTMLPTDPHNPVVAVSFYLPFTLYLLYFYLLYFYLLYFYLLYFYLYTFTFYLLPFTFYLLPFILLYFYLLPFTFYLLPFTFYLLPFTFFFLIPQYPLTCPPEETTHWE